jgi:hypothetical protein
MCPGINFINMFMHGFFTGNTKKQLVFENEFQHAFLYENSAGCTIHKSLLAVLVVLVAIPKLQLAVCRKALKKLRIKMLMKSTPWTINLFKAIVESES